MIELELKKHLLTSDGGITLDIGFAVAPGEFVALFGKSGVGKTTLLRIIAGLDTPDEGRLVVNGETWLDTARRINLAPQKRGVGLVFQDYALFPNLTVRGNLEFALANRKERGHVEELIDLMDLRELQHRKPSTLSGGQQQRVALARALVRRPRLLLLDEPLSALDAETRLRLQDEILRIHTVFNITTLIVSHDLGEVFKLAKRVLVIEQGRIVRTGRPAEVFSNRNLSGKLQFTGEVLEIEPSDVVYTVSVLVSNQIVKVIATQEEVHNLHIGDKVMLLSKAFNPMLLKVG